MRRHLNRTTQPVVSRPVFNNWGVVACGWYIACASRELPRGRVTGRTLCGQRVVLFRGEDGTPRCLDAFCPHMGADLGIGTVRGNTLRCFFHHWSYDGEGTCVDIPCQKAIPPSARLQAYAVEEKYGFLWVWPESTAPHPVPDFEGLEGMETVTRAGRAFERTCHHHVCMINGIDPQHLRTVHRLRLDMALTVDQTANGHVQDYILAGEIPGDSVSGRLLRSLIGPRYSYAMRYSDGTLGLLTTVREGHLIHPGWRLPRLHMFYAYTPLRPGRIRIQPVFVTRRRRGPHGALLSWLFLLLMQVGYRVLRDEDGRVYDNIRFHTGSLLPLDAPVARFASWIDSLKPSPWSLSSEDSVPNDPPQP